MYTYTSTINDLFDNILKNKKGVPLLVRLFNKIQFREVYKLLEIIWFGHFFFKKQSFIYF